MAAARWASQMRLRASAAVGDTAAGSDEPGEAAFDHWSEAPVVVGEVAVAPGSAGFDELAVVDGEAQDAAVAGGGAAGLGSGSRGSALEDSVVGGGEATVCPAGQVAVRAV